MTTRRHVIAALAAGALGAPVLSLGQPKPNKVYRLGYLASDAEPRNSPTFKALVSALQRLGWIEGKNIVMLTQSSGGRLDLFPQLAAELVRSDVDAIVTGGSAATQAAKAATRTIPIVFASAANPVEQNLVSTLAQPGANVTGLALAVGELGPKRLQLLKEMLPRATHFARLYQAGSIAPLQPSIITEDDSAARRLNVTLDHVPVTNLETMRLAFATAARNRVDAIILTGAGLFVANRRLIASLGLEQRLPTMCADDRFTEAGALASYGENFAQRYRRVALLVDKILRGAKPASIPVEQPALFELVINLQTAKALGVTIPEPLLVQADRTIK